MSVSAGVDKRVLDHYRTAELSRIGASVDYYFHNDLNNPAMPDYLLYVMINTYCLSAKEREAIHRKAVKNHATVVWLYAPGLIDLSQENPLDNRHIALTTGMNVERLDTTHSVKFDITLPDHPAMKYAVPDVKYGYIRRPVNSVIWVGNQLDTPFLNPCFVIRDETAVELGRFCIDGEVAMAYKEYKGFTSVYCTAQVLNAELLTGLAEWAGCHIYGYDDDCLYANDNFVTLHAKYTGKHIIHFKEPCCPFEIYQGRFYGKDVTRLELDMRLGDTLTFCVNPQVIEAANQT